MKRGSDTRRNILSSFVDDVVAVQIGSRNEEVFWTAEVIRNSVDVEKVVDDLAVLWYEASER